MQAAIDVVGVAWLLRRGAIGNAAAENAASAKMEAREELLEETAANNEGMPEAKNDESAKSAMAGE